MAQLVRMRRVLANMFELCFIYFSLSVYFDVS